MDCPYCGYVLAPYDRSCPKCTYLARTQTTGPRSSHTAPVVPTGMAGVGRHGYKTCPRCAQPAVLNMAVCGRCGYPYGPAMTAEIGKRRGALVGLGALLGVIT